MRAFLSLFFLAILTCFGVGYYALFANNISSSRTTSYVNIPNGSEFSDVLKLLKEKRILENEAMFALWAKQKGYDQAVKSGRYHFSKRMNNREIVNMLLAGRQSLVSFSLFDIKTKSEFASLIGRKFEIDSLTWIQFLDDYDFTKHDLTHTNSIAFFVNETYESKWNSTPTDLMSMFEEKYKSFWSNERNEKLKDLGMTKGSVVTLASIVEKECMKADEMPKVAAVYINRLRIGMPLQADPTLKFATGDFNAKRVLNWHKEFDSPYNTYKYRGLPPGPICIPRKNAIDAVLNHDLHDYIYFCANPDMSGYSVFSTNLDDHNKVAVAYRHRLNEMNVK